MHRWLCRRPEIPIAELDKARLRRPVAARQFRGVRPAPRETAVVAAGVELIGPERADVSVTGEADLIDAFEMACSLGPLDCVVIETFRRPAEGPVVTTASRSRIVKSVAGWYPVALSAGLDRGTSNGTHLFGRELVIWRDGDGAVHVWEDRCPHRGMRLSFGFVRDNRLACLYHGWTYDMAGQCRYIPAHPQLTPPASIKAEVYPTGDAAGMVWVYSEISATPPAMPEDRPVTPVRSLHVDCAPEAALARLRSSNFRPTTMPRRRRRVST